MTSVALFGLLILALAGCESADHSGASQPQPVPAAPTARPEPSQAQTDPLLPPPLAEPAENTGSLDEYLTIVEQATPPEPKETDQADEDQAYLYMWTDDSGNPHVVDNETQVPPNMRSRVQKIPVQQENAAAPDGRRAKQADNPAYDPNVPPLPGLGGSAPPPETQTGNAAGSGSFLDHQKAKQAGYRSWTDRLAALRAKLEQTRATLAETEGQPPDCSLSLSPGLGGAYDPNCEGRWRAYIKSLKTQIAKLEKAIADLKEEARRAGVPPGYVR
jgi:hypothetical protein